MISLFFKKILFLKHILNCWDQELVQTLWLKLHKQSCNIVTPCIHEPWPIIINSSEDYYHMKIAHWLCSVHTLHSSTMTRYLTGFTETHSSLWLSSVERSTFPLPLLSVRWTAPLAQLQISHFISLCTLSISVLLEDTMDGCITSSCWVLAWSTCIVAVGLMLMASTLLIHRLKKHRHASIFKSNPFNPLKWTAFFEIHACKSCQLPSTHIILTPHISC